MNILNECDIATIDDIIIMGYSVCVTLHRRIYVNIIGGKYIFRVKTNKTLKEFVLFFGVFFFLGGGGGGF